MRLKIDEYYKKSNEELKTIEKIENNRNNIKLDIFLNLIKKPTVNTRGSKYIDKIDEGLSVYSNSCGTLDLGRAGFKRNSFIYNVYINKFNEQS